MLKMSFDRFTSLLAEVGNAFSALKEKFPDEIRCHPGCDDCCSAFFDVSFVEAEYIRLGLTCLSEVELGQVREQAEVARTKTAEHEKDFYAGSGHKARETQVGNWRIRCPMLTREKRCIVYAHRPVTCRAYGVPTSIGDKGHVCGFSGFDKGLTYPTIKLDQINQYLLALSSEYATVKRIPAVEAPKRVYLFEVVLGLSDGVVNL
jgi:Fe-S-cluster containining protein